MKVAFLFLTLIALLALPLALKGDGCRLQGVDPDTAKIGDTLGARGESIGKTSVDELYLTDGTTDYKMVIVQQDEKVIRFKIPANVKPGRYNLMIKTAGASPKLLEQPVKLEIEG